MKHDECFQLGIILKKVGREGKVSIKLDADNPNDYKEMESVFLEIHGKLVPFFIEQFILFNDDTAHLKFEDINSNEEAESILGCGLFLPLEVLPQLKGNKFYFHEVIGFEVVNKKDLISAGIITSIFENSSNDLFVCSLNEEEILIPIAEDWILEVNRSEKKIYMDLPDGLININQKS